MDLHLLEIHLADTTHAALWLTLQHASKDGASFHTMLSLRRCSGDRRLVPRCFCTMAQRCRNNMDKIHHNPKSTTRRNRQPGANAAGVHVPRGDTVAELIRENWATPWCKAVIACVQADGSAHLPTSSRAIAFRLSASSREQRTTWIGWNLTAARFSWRRRKSSRSCAPSRNRRRYKTRQQRLGDRCLNCRARCHGA